MTRKVYVIIVAAGSGTRFGAARPKQFCTLSGHMVLEHSIEAFRRAVPDVVVTLVLSEYGRDIWLNYCREVGCQSPQVVIGGDTRAASVVNALIDIEANADIKDDDIVLVHDGARPLLPDEVIYNVLKAVDEDTGVIPVISVTDSLRERCEGGGSRAVDRSRFRAVQTPQGYNLKGLLKAYDSIKDRMRYTDDASVFEAAGGKVVMVDGSPINIKITNPADLSIAEALINLGAFSNNNER